MLVVELVEVLGCELSVEYLACFTDTVYFIR